jgi:hypothetical protein
MLKSLLIALVAFVCFAASATAQPGQGPVPPANPWLYAAPMIYPPAGSCVALPQTVTGGCAFANSLNIAGSYYVNGVNIFASSHAWPGDQFFGSGRPWCSMGASPGLSVDASTLIANCNTVLAAFGGGEIRPEAGETYCIQNNTTLSTNVGLRAPGSSYSNSGAILTSAGCTTPTDTTIVTLGTGGFAFGISFMCYGFGATQPCVTVTGNRVVMGLNRILGGSIPLNATPGVDGHFSDMRISNGVGAANVVGSGYFDRLILNQPLATGCSATASQGAISAWAAATPYTACNFVTLSGMILQATTSFTSGGSLTIPANTQVQATITDGAGAWELIAPTTFYGLQCLAYCVERVVDHTGPYTAGSAATSANSQLYVVTSSYGLEFTAGILVTNGIAWVNTINVSPLTGNAASGVLSETSAQNSHVTNMQFLGVGAYGIQFLSGTDNIATGNMIGGATSAAIHVGNGQNNSLITSNSVGNPGGTGGNAHSIILDASSDYDVVLGNNCNGATSGLTNNSGGAHNYIPPGGNPGC